MACESASATFGGASCAKQIAVRHRKEAQTLSFDMARFPIWAGRPTLFCTTRTVRLPHPFASFAKGWVARNLNREQLSMVCSRRAWAGASERTASRGDEEP